MRRKPCEKNEEENVLMTEKNLAICLTNQEGFESKQLNDSLHLQFYGFCEINNLSPYKNLHTIFLNNNVLEQIQNLESLTSLTTLNLAYNRIKKFTGLKTLISLHTLDVSNNLIEEIPEEQIIGLNKLSILKLGHNKISSYLAIKPLVILNKSLTCLQLNANQDFPFDQLFYSEFLSTLTLLSVLTLQKTKFNREVPSYRKETICASNSLLFLDDRPVTEDERMLAKAWKEGGIIFQRQVRQKIKEKIEEKHGKIYAQMEERTKIADQKRKLAYNKLTHREQDLLRKLVLQKESQDYSLLCQDQKNELNLQIQDLRQYLKLMVSQMQNCDLEKILNDGRLEVPKMIIDKQTPEAIYIYNVGQQLLPLIKQKYYPQQTRELIAVPSTSNSESRWIKQYDALLLDCYNQTRGNQRLLVPTFNLSLYDFDKSTGRKIKRFQIDELQQYLRKNTQQQDRRQKSIQVLYELD